MLPAVKAEREGVYLWPALSNLEVIGKKLTVNRLNLRGLGSVWSVRSGLWQNVLRRPSSVRVCENFWEMR